MKIGIFDSGLGGLVVLKELRRQLPQFDYLYLGDTKNLPYGEKSQSRIFELTKKAVNYLFEQNCELVIVACNTASSQALRRLQQGHLPQSRYQDRRILGVIRPTAEVAKKFKSVGIIGTRRTIDSKAYVRELKKLNPQIKITQVPTPELVPMIEAGELDTKILGSYMKKFKHVQALILGCTHYGLTKSQMTKLTPAKIRIIAQEEILSDKLRDYLKHHPELAAKLTRNSRVVLSITKSSPRYRKLAKQWFGPVKLKTVKY